MQNTQWCRTRFEYLGFNIAQRERIALNEGSPGQCTRSNQPDAQKDIAADR